MEHSFTSAEEGEREGGTEGDNKVPLAHMYIRMCVRTYVCTYICLDKQRVHVRFVELHICKLYPKWSQVYR